MSDARDNFMPTGKLTIETGLDSDGEHSWRLDLDGIAQTDAIGIMVIAIARYVLGSLKGIQRVDHDDDPPGWE